MSLTGILILRTSAGSLAMLAAIAALSFRAWADWRNV